MRPIREIVRNESVFALAKEAFWRTQKQWNMAQFQRRVGASLCPVSFQPVGYFAASGAIDRREQAAIVSFADRALSGVFSVLGYEPVNLGFPPPWTMDFVSGKSWPMLASAQCNYIRHDGSDIKTVWELSRLQVLPILAKAHRLTGEERYRTAARELCSDWIARNPVGVGPNWTVAMEVSLRAISMSFLCELLWPVRSDELEWLDSVTRSLWQHQLYVASHLEFSHLFRGNHYLSNVLGLFCLSLYLDGPGSKRDRERLWQRLQSEVLHQTYNDGGNYEASLGYHVLTTQMAMVGFRLARAAGLGIRPEFEERLGQMFGLLRDLADEHGSIPQIGDCDDGRVELFLADLERARTDPTKNQSSLQIPDFLDALESLTRKTASPSRPSQSTIYADSGIAALGSDDMQVIFLAIPNGIYGKGSHTHNDKLSVICRVAGSDLLIDSGTGCYTRDAVLRNRLRSTLAHNTIVVDGLEQNTIFGGKDTLFCLGNEAAVTAIESIPDHGNPGFRATHHGYDRVGVTHTRAVTCSSTGTIAIEDRLQGSGEHRFEAHFHLGPGWIPEVSGETCSIRGPRPVTLTFKSNAKLEVACRASQFSRAYGSVSTGHEIVVSGKPAFPAVLTTTISLT